MSVTYCNIDFTKIKNASKTLITELNKLGDKAFRKEIHKVVYAVLQDLNIKNESEIKQILHTSCLSKSLKSKKIKQELLRLSSYNSVSSILNSRNLNTLPNRSIYSVNIKSAARFIPIFTDGLNMQIKTQLDNVINAICIWENNGKDSKLFVDTDIQGNIKKYMNDLFKKCCVLAGYDERVLYKFGKLNKDADYNTIMSEAASKLPTKEALESLQLNHPLVQQVTAFYTLLHFDDVIESLAIMLEIDPFQKGKLTDSTNKYSIKKTKIQDQVYESDDNSQIKEDSEKFENKLFKKWFYSIPITSVTGEIQGYLSEQDLQKIRIGLWKLYDKDAYYDAFGIDGSIKAVHIQDVLDFSSNMDISTRTDHIIQFVDQLDLDNAIKNSFKQTLTNFQSAISNYKKQYRSSEEDQKAYGVFDMRQNFFDDLDTNRTNSVTETDEFGNIIEHISTTERKSKVQVREAIKRTIVSNLEKGLLDYYSPYFIYDDAGNELGRTQVIFSDKFYTWFFNAFGIDLKSIADADKADLGVSITNTAIQLCNIINKAIRQSAFPKREIESVIDNLKSTDWIQFSNLLVLNSPNYKRKMIDLAGNQIPNHVIPAAVNRHVSLIQKLPQQIRQNIFLAREDVSAVINHKRAKFKTPVVCKTLVDFGIKQVHAGALNVKEMMSHALGTYFFKNAIENGMISLQPYDASDKSRQFMDSIQLLKEDSQGGVSYNRDVIGVTNLKHLAFEQHRAYYNYLAESTIAKYNELLGSSIIVAGDPLLSLEVIQTELDNFTIEAFDALVTQAIARNPNFQLTQNNDFVKQKDHYSLNASLYYFTALAQSEEAYNVYMQQSFKQFCEQLQELNSFITLPNQDWFKEHVDEINTFLGLTGLYAFNGNEKFSPRDTFKQLKYTENPVTKSDYLINKIVELYFYYDVLISDSDMMIVAQTPLNHGKSKINVTAKTLHLIDTAIHNNDASNITLKTLFKEIQDRYVTSTKRGNVNVSTIIPYRSSPITEKGSFHISPKMKIAPIESLKRNLVNYQGDKNIGQPVHDGECVSNGIWAYFENRSCKNGHFLQGSKKNLCFGIQVGSVTAIKCADYECNNEYMRWNGVTFQQGDNIVRNSVELFKRSCEPCVMQGIDATDIDVLNKKWKKPIFLILNGQEVMFRNLVLDAQGLKAAYYTVDSNTEIFSEPINTLTDLWEALGAQWSKDEFGTFNEASIEYCANFVAYVKPEFKQQMVAKYVTKDSIKSGIINCNSEKAWEGHDTLKTHTISTELLGIQNDSTHEADESLVAGPTQVVSAVGFNGVKVQRSSELYNAYSKLVMAGADLGITFNSDAERQKVLTYISKALLRSLETAKDISDARMIVDNAFQEILKNPELKELQIGISNRTLFSKIASNILSSLTNKSLKTKFNGIAAIMNPSYNTIRVYDYYENGQHLYATTTDLLHIAKEKGYKGNTPEETIKLLLDSQDFIKPEIDNVADLHISDNVIIQYLNQDGSVEHEEEFYIETPQHLMGIAAKLNLGGIKILLDNTKARDLRPLQITYKENGIRKNFWCNEKVQALIALQGDKTNPKYKKTLLEYRQLLVNLSVAKNNPGYKGFSDIQFEPGEQILPKVNRKAHKLGDLSLLQVQRQGHMSSVISDMLDLNIDEDIVKDSKDYVVIKNNEKTFIIGEFIFDDKVIMPERDVDGLWKFFDENQNVICEAPSKRSGLIKKGDSELYISIPDGVNLRHYVKNLTKEDDNDSFFYKGEKYSFIHSFNNFLSSEVANLDTKLTYEDDFIDTKYNELQSSFEMSNDSVSLRIPSQSYSSFMAMKTVAFLEGNINDCYTNVWQMWFQGSDFDIDKNYTIMYSLDSQGRIASWSPLFDYSSKQSLAESMSFLPLPKNDKIIVKGDQDTFTPYIESVVNFYKKTYGDADNADVKFLGNLLRAINISDLTLTFNESTSPDIINVIEKINNHQLYEPSKKGLKNKIVSTIFDASSDVENLEHSTQPMDSAPFNNVLSKLDSVFKDNKNPDYIHNPLLKYGMIHKNYVGKKCVGIFANGIKVLSTVQQYFNKKILDNKYDQIAAFNLGNIAFNIKLTEQEAIALSEKIPAFTPKILSNNDGTFTLKIKKTNVTRFSNVQFDKKTISKIFNFFKDSEVVAYTEKSKEIIDAFNQIKDQENLGDNLSILISLAVDNAKELSLEKMNCNEDTAKGLISLFSLGFSIEESLTVFYTLVGDIVNELEVNRFVSTKPSIGKIIPKLELDPETKHGLQTIFEIGDEFSNLARFFKINRGVPASYTEAISFLNSLSNIKKSFVIPQNINDFIAKYQLQDIDSGFIMTTINSPFYLEQFISNKDYQRVLVALNNENKLCINSFDVILNSDHFFAMLASFNRCITDLNKLSALSSFVSYNPDLITSGDYEELKKGQLEISIIQKQMIWHHYIIGEFLKSQKRFTFSSYQLGKQLQDLRLQVPLPPQFVTFDLGSKTGVETFKSFMDTYIIQYLKPKFKDKNSFIDKLQLQTSYKDGSSYYNIDINQYDFESRYTQELMTDLRASFRSIALLNSGITNMQGQPLRIGELLYFYDLITTKRQIGKMQAIIDIDAIDYHHYNDKLNKLYYQKDLDFSSYQKDNAKKAEQRNLFQELYLKGVSAFNNGTIVKPEFDSNVYYSIQPTELIYTFSPLLSDEVNLDNLKEFIDNLKAEFNLEIEYENCD